MGSLEGQRGVSEDYGEDGEEGVKITNPRVCPKDNNHLKI